ncbi:MAG TPA: hypothetical protein VMQ10_17350, partial [Spirochaetia bacterium]|nr:hypothetical protein [Spirochaetia bacterium]
TWYLIASVASGDDTNGANNVLSSSAITVNPPNIDYTVTVVNNTGATTGGAALAGNFTIKNSGTAGGSASVTWTAYISPDATLDLSDIAIATSTVGALGAGATNGPIGFAGTWPAGAATWFLIVRVAASDDVNAANDYTPSASVGVVAATPTYSITAVPAPTGTIAGQAVSGTFTIQNSGLTAGSAAINYQVYASLGDTVYNGGDVLLASGSTPALGLAGSSSPGWAGTWPSTPGSYSVVVRASASDAPSIADAASAGVSVTSPPPPDYTVSFNAAIPWSGVVGTLMSATGTPQITISNTSSNPGTANVNWAVYLSTDNVLDAGDTLLASGANTPLAGLGFVTKSFDSNWPAAPGRFYWFISRVSASDDTDPANDTLVSHPVGTGTFRYAEGAEDNSSAPTATAHTSSTPATTMAPGKTLVIEGVMDAFNAYDTYNFVSTSTMAVGMQARWATGFDDLDLYLWDSLGSSLNSIETGTNAEPSYGTFDTTSVSARTWYVSAKFWLDNNTSGSTGQKYIILVVGE